MKLRNKNKILDLIFLLIMAGGLFWAGQTLAQNVSLGIEYGSNLNLGSRDLREIIMSIVQVLLGFLGVVAILITLYGGFLYLMSKGDAAKIETAKKILINGAIGLAIILSAFAIVTFVVNSLGETTISGPVCTDGEIRSCSSIGDCSREQTCANSQWGICVLTDPDCDPFDQDIFALTATAPTNNQELPISNVVVQLTFTNNLANVNLNSGAAIKHCQNSQCQATDLDVPVVGSISSNPKQAEIRPDNSLPEYQCPGWGTTISPAQYPNLACFPYNKDNNLNWYQVTITTDENFAFRNTSGLTITCQAGVPCQFKFRIGELVDLEPPTVNLTEAEDALQTVYPWISNNLNLSSADEFIFRAEATDDAGLATINFFEQETPLNLGFAQPPNGATQFTGASINPWATSNYEVGNVFNIKSTVTDYAANSADSIKQITLYPAHCYNSSCDEGESCFTDPTKPYNCGDECPACAGSSCSLDPNTCVPNNAACYSSVCIPEGLANSCTCQPSPVISGVTPIDGAPGNFITISGQGFGTTVGTVELVNINHPTEIFTAGFPSQAVPECSNTWTDTQVIIMLRTMPQDVYFIRLKAVNPYYPAVGPQYLSDEYGNAQNETPLTVNDVVRPGLCLLNPSTGLPESTFALAGVGFGSGSDARSIEFGAPGNSTPANNPNFISEMSAAADVPNLVAGQPGVFVTVNGESSNPMAFTVQSTANQNTPYISGFTPDSGANGQYVTISGSNFGDYNPNQSQVKFNNIAVDFGAFPADCSTDFWHDDFIVVKVPDGTKLTGVITVLRADGAQAVSGSNFTYNATMPLTPGICSLTPSEGVIGDDVTIVGEYFTGTAVNFTGEILTTAPILGGQIGQGVADRYEVQVPQTAQSGEVKVQNSDTSSIVSAPWPFAVEEILDVSGGNFGFYQWQFLTCMNCLVPAVVEDPSCVNQLASPSPPSSGDGNTTAYINSVLGVRFNTDMADNSFIYNTVGQTGPTYIIQQCNEGLSYDPETCSNFTYSGFAAGYPAYSNNSEEYVQVKPNVDFLPGYWYRVILTNGLVSQIENYPLENGLNFPPPPAAPNSFEWHFRTRTTPEACEPNAVSVEPAHRLEVPNWPANPIIKNEHVNYSSCGVNDGICAICPNNFKWSWSKSATPPALADNFSLYDEPFPYLNPPDDDSLAYVLAEDYIRNPEWGEVSAAITQVAVGNPPVFTAINPPLTDTADLQIVPSNPYLDFDSCFMSGGNITEWPTPTPYVNQSGVCLNAKISASFVDVLGNAIAMDFASIQSSLKINNELATSLGVLDPIYSGTEVIGFVLTPTNNFTPGANYVVSLVGIKSIDDMPLYGITSWNFTAGNSVCDFTTVMVQPSPRIIDKHLSGTANYSASGLGGQCLLLVDPPNSSWTWSTDDPDIATVAGNSPPNDNTAVVTAGDLGNTFVKARLMPVNIQNTNPNGLLTVIDSGLPMTNQYLSITNHQPQSPPPVCLNSLITIDFSDSIELANSPQNDPDSVAKCLNSSCSSVEGEWIVSNSNKHFEFYPDNNFDSLSNYYVSIKTGSDGVVTINGNKYLTPAQCFASGLTTIIGNTCGWYFDTADALCDVDSIKVNLLNNASSTSATVEDGDFADWQATAYSQNNQPLTNVVDTWQADQEEVAVLSPIPEPPVYNNNYQRSAGQIYGILSEANITAIIYQDPADIISNPGHLTVTPVLLGPNVIETKPQNGDANVCLNSMVSVKFGSHVNPDTVNENNFKINYHLSSLNTVEDSILAFSSSNYVVAPAGGSADLNMAADESFMAEAWVKIPTNEDEGVVIGKWGVAGWWFGVDSASWTNPANTTRAWARLAGPQYDPESDPDELTNNINWDRHVFSSNVVNNIAVNNNTWRHVVLLVNRANQTGQMYIDGAVSGSATNIALVGDMINVNNLSLGAHFDGTTGLNGYIAAVRVYKFAASMPGNINDLIKYQYDHPTSINSQLAGSLVGRWEMNEGTGNTVADTSGSEINLAPPDPANMPVWDSANLPFVSGCQQVAAVNTQMPKTNSVIFNTIIGRFFNFIIADIFNSLAEFAYQKAYASAGQGFVINSGYWCPLENNGEWQLSDSALFSTVQYQLSQLLPADKIIQVKVAGGQSGVKGTNGQELENQGDDFSYMFETGSTYCALNFVKITSEDNLNSGSDYTFITPEDDTADNVIDPGSSMFDSKADSDKVLYAHGFTVSGEELQMVPGIPPLGYSWTWNWETADPDIAKVLYSSSTLNYVLVGAENQNGETPLTLSADFSPIYQTASLTDAGNIIVDLCANPWPQRVPGNTSVQKYVDNNYHFALRYCRDAGDIGTEDDLPALEDDFVIANPPTSSPTADELLREYLIAVPTTGDVLGLKIFENSFHLTPQEWYAQNIDNKGNPVNKTIDGYQAIEEGRTVYVVAANKVGNYCQGNPALSCDDNNDCWLDVYVGPCVPASYYTNTYLFSHNQDLSAASADIVKQLLENWEFNTNIAENETKEKLIHDTQRITGLTSMANALENYRVNNSNTYPTLPSGSFINGFTVSAWPSWSSALGTALGLSMPTDPLNTFNACIDCEEPALINGDFEATSLTISWDSESGVTAAINTGAAGVHGGQQSVIVGTAVPDAGINTNEDIRLINNTTYELGAWVYVEAPNRAQLNFTCYSGGGAIVNCGQDFGNLYFTPPDFTGWFQLKNRLISPNSGDITVQIFVRSFNNNSSNAAFYVDDVTIQTEGGNCGYDPATCWNPEANQSQGAFACDDGSYIYSYQSLPQNNYKLSAKMETAVNWLPQNIPETPPNIPGVQYLDPHIQMSLTNVAVCTIAGGCGNGLVTPPAEQCEAGMNTALCPLGSNWNHPQSVGCVTDTCQWSNPFATDECSGMTTAQCCGGYCGDGVLNTATAYNITPDEFCDPSAPINSDGYANGQPQNSSATSQYVCSNSCLESGGYCGDNARQSAYEQCDGASKPLNTSCSTNNTCTASCNFNFLSCDGPVYDFDGCEVNKTTGVTAGNAPVVYHCGSCNNNCAYTGNHGQPICNYPATPNCKIQCDPGFHCASDTTLPYLTTCNPTDTCEPDCGDGYISGTEDCDPGSGSIPPAMPASSPLCQALDSDYPDYTYGGKINSCTSECKFDTSVCCTDNALSVKFTGLNTWKFYASPPDSLPQNVVPLISYASTTINPIPAGWKRLGEADVELVPNARNVLAFEVHSNLTPLTSLGGIASFSCQPKHCQKVCFMGPNAGNVCNSNVDCQTPGQNPPIGQCYTPSGGTKNLGDVCNNNRECDGTFPAFPAEQPKPSTCLPDSYAALTNASDWQCVSSNPTTGWNYNPFTPFSGTPNSTGIIGEWANNWAPSYRGNKVPQAAAIRSTAGGDDAYCRLTLDLRPPEPPFNQVVCTANEIANQPNTMSLSWNNISEADYYQVYYSSNGAGFNIIEDSVYGTNFIHNDASSSGINFYKVLACNSYGCVDESYAPVCSGAVWTAAQGTIFITNQSFNGNLVTASKNTPYNCSTSNDSGVVAANCICNYLAAQPDAANYVKPGAYRAIIGGQAGNVKTTNFNSTFYNGPYKKTDVNFTTIANSLDDLFDGTISSPVNSTQSGASANSVNVWTSLNGSGVYQSSPGVNEPCVANTLPWQQGNNPYQSKYGKSDETNGKWLCNGSNANCDTGSSYIGCGTQNRLYCALYVPASLMPQIIEFNAAPINNVPPETYVGFHWSSINTTTCGLTGSLHDEILPAGPTNMNVYLVQVNATETFYLGCVNSGNGLSAGSQITITVGSPPPLAPTIFVSSAQTQTSITLNWVNGTNPAPNYNILDRYSAGCTSLLTSININPANNSYIDSNLASGTYYCYRVSACLTGVGCSPINENPSLTVSTSQSTVNAPTGFNATVNDNTITLSWTTPAGQVTTGYILDRERQNYPPNNNWTDDDLLPEELLATQTSHTDSLLFPNTNYRYFIKACIGDSYDDDHCSSPVPLPGTGYVSTAQKGTIFLSSQSYPPTFEGEDGNNSDWDAAEYADSHCTTLANTSTIVARGQWVAWLTDSNTTMTSKFTGNNLYNGPLKLRSGADTPVYTTIADNWSDFIVNGPELAINCTEQSLDLIACPFSGSRVWTGTNEGGTFMNENQLTCAKWTTDQSNFDGYDGLTSDSSLPPSDDWTKSALNACGSWPAGGSPTQLNLYCIFKSPNLPSP